MQPAAFHLDSKNWEGEGILFALCKTLPFLEHLLLYQDTPWHYSVMLYLVFLLLVIGKALQWASACNTLLKLLLGSRRGARVSLFLIWNLLK